MLIWVKKCFSFIKNKKWIKKDNICRYWNWKMQISVQQKSNFYKDDVDVDKILLSNKILFGGKGFKVLLLTKIMKK